MEDRVVALFTLYVVWVACSKVLFLDYNLLASFLEIDTLAMG